MKREFIDTHIYFPPTVFEKMKQLAGLNRRTMSAEMVIAAEAHLMFNKPTLLLADAETKRGMKGGKRK